MGRWDGGGCVVLRNDNDDERVNVMKYACKGMCIWMMCLCFVLVVLLDCFRIGNNNGNGRKR